VPLDEVSNALLGQMYRYRLAVHDQDARVRAAMELLRKRRETIEQSAHDLLFAPSMGIEDFERQLKAIYSEDIPEIWRLQTESQFLLTAMRGVLVMVKAIRDALEMTSIRGTLDRALGDFQQKVPDPTLLRNIHEHLDAFVHGRGHQQGLLSGAVADGLVAMTEAGLVYLIGGRLFNLAEMVEATEELAAAVVEATRYL
jgi:hypothetical protein